MVQKRRPSKKTGFEYLTVMIPAEFRAELVKQAENEGRTLSDVVRERMQRPLSPNDRGISPRAGGLGRLVGLFANDVLTHAPGDKQMEYLRTGVSRLMDRLSKTPNLRGPENDAQTMADYWWLSYSNADARTYADGKALPLSQEQQALVEIRRDIEGGEEPLPSLPPRKVRR